MKYKIRKTQEIVDVITYRADDYDTKERRNNDWVSFIDSKGEEHHKEHLNIWWDFEEMETYMVNYNYNIKPYEIVDCSGGMPSTNSTPIINYK